jgi:hypothetical protein
VADCCVGFGFGCFGIMLFRSNIMKVSEQIYKAADKDKFSAVHCLPFFFADLLVTDLKIDCCLGFGCHVLCIVASIGAAEMQAEEN